MRVYSYEPETGEYKGDDEAIPCPLANPTGDPKGDWIFPASCTTIEPPMLVKGNVVVFRKGKWGYVYPDEPDMKPSATPLEPKPEPPPRDPNGPPEGWVEPDNWWPPFDWKGTPGWKPKPEWLEAKAAFEKWQAEVAAAALTAEAEAKAAKDAG